MCRFGQLGNPDFCAPDNFMRLDGPSRRATMTYRAYADKYGTDPLKVTLAEAERIEADAQADEDINYRIWTSVVADGAARRARAIRESLNPGCLPDNVAVNGCVPEPKVSRGARMRRELRRIRRDTDWVGVAIRIVLLLLLAGTLLSAVVVEDGTSVILKGALYAVVGACIGRSLARW